MATSSDVRKLAQALWERRYLAALDTKKRQTLAEMLQAEFYRRGQPERYKGPNPGTETHWVTVGGTPGDKGEHEGGTPIQVDGLGRVHGGPPGLKGKTLGGGHAPPQAAPKPKHAPELPKDAPAVPDTIGDRNAVADKHGWTSHRREPNGGQFTEVDFCAACSNATRRPARKKVKEGMLDVAGKITTDIAPSP